MNMWLIVFAGGAATYAMRLSFIYLLGRIGVSEVLRRALRFVPPAVLSAIVLPELLAPGGTIALGPDNHRLLAGMFAVVVAWRTRNAVATTLAGMLVLLALQAAP